MNTMEWHTFDKTAWGPGPWQDEPDKRQWQDARTGLPCLIVRNHGGALCGYVGIPDDHLWHGKDYGDMDVDVHGGLTFASLCHPITPESFDAIRTRVERGRDEAKIHPRGDAARLVADWGEITTFAAFQAKAQGRFICHIPAPGEPDNVWWFGFDCAHADDLSPAYNALLPDNLLDADESYKDIVYVTRECAQLAAQLAAVVTPR